MYGDGNASAGEAEGEEADTAAADDDDWEVRGLVIVSAFTFVEGQ